MVGQRRFRLNEVSALNKDHVKIRDPDKVELMLNELVAGGIEKLQVVTDFDYTITKQRLSNGEKILTSFGMFNECRSLPASVLLESKKLFEKYRPIEIDPHMPLEEKIIYMIEWWSKTGDLLKGFPLPQEEIAEVAKRFKEGLRDGTHQMFWDLNEQRVPCLVFSAGLGDSVVSVLRQADVLHPNVKVISNFLQYGADGNLNGLQEKMIHTFNKNETALEGTEYYDLVHDRDHVIVMGDSIGDAGMADGIPSSSHVLKIGFLFDHPEQNLPRYMDTFDIVLIDDQTMDVPRAILEMVKNKSHQ
ncbi:7-methylguanosine phosphate-specific 5'-nucleotidase [Wyeomyia smithii]|uniref:7-methylguanosine phosphate-specific 5'-nucleotidase n=1 Tax=Wyeomyia smithii TaxID=174621 RepID=UPI002467E354|nr:7-methylguanosine phosphate-specific 5'-nucleotidase [Wyeomyia smithii]XP_055530430.1 7-methylguanosine phosphate-specific 5'-nucleotidase [Wyeomyia smithii]